MGPSACRAQLSQCSVLAPFTGRIVRMHVKPHQGVNVGSPLVEMVSEGPLKVRLNAPSRLLRTLQVGTPFEVAIDETGKSYAAKVTAINARVDAVAQTVELEGASRAKPRASGGMTGVPASGSERPAMSGEHSGRSGRRAARGLAFSELVTGLEARVPQPPPWRSWGFRWRTTAMGCCASDRHWS